MKLKAVSMDADAFRLLREAKGPRESYSDVLRRVLTSRAEENYDPSDELGALFAQYGGKGVLTEVGRARLRARCKVPN